MLEVSLVAVGGNVSLSFQQGTSPPSFDRPDNIVAHALFLRAGSINENDEHVLKTRHGHTRRQEPCTPGRPPCRPPTPACSRIRGSGAN